MSTAPKEAPRLGKYLLLKKLGGGGMGRVYLASLAGPMAFEKKVVIKTILPAYTQNKDFVQLFLNEARLGARLSHSAVAQIYELGEENGLYYLVMEHVDGWTLRQAILAAKRAKKSLNPARVAEVLARSCEGLHYAHTLSDKDGKPLGVVHRDLSPQNIMISREGDVKVIDFGVARSDLSTNETVAGTIKGKLSYMSPEQARGERVDLRSDIFALGVVLYEALTNRNPFDLDSPLSILRALETLDPPALKYVDAALGPFDPIVRRCLQKDKDLRYPDCRELRMDLLGVLERARASQRDHLGSWAASVLEGVPTAADPLGAGGDPGGDGSRTQVEAVPNPFEGPHDPGEALPDEPEAELPLEAQATMLKPEPVRAAVPKTEQATVLRPHGSLPAPAGPSHPPARRPAAPPALPPDDDFEDDVSHVSGLRRSPPWLLIGAATATAGLVLIAVVVKMRRPAPPSPAAAAIPPANPAQPPEPPAAPPPEPSKQVAAAAPLPPAEPAPSPAPSEVVPEPAVAEPEPVAAVERARHHRRRAASSDATAAPPVVMAEAPIEGLVIRTLGETRAVDPSGQLVNSHVPQPTSARLTIGSLTVKLSESRQGGARLLSIASQPWAIASVDGVSRGKTPLAAVPLPDHGLRLELIRPGMDAPAVLQIRPSGQ